MTNSVVLIALRETGFLFKDLIERRVRVLSKWICQINNLEMKDMDETIAHVMDEELDQYHSCIDWLSYTGRKASSTICKKASLNTAPHKGKHAFSSLRIDSSNTTPPPPSPPPPSVAWNRVYLKDQLCSLHILFIILLHLAFHVPHLLCYFL